MVARRGILEDEVDAEVEGDVQHLSRELDELVVFVDASGSSQSGPLG